MLKPEVLGGLIAWLTYYKLKSILEISAIHPVTKKIAKIIWFDDRPILIFN